MFRELPKDKEPGAHGAARRAAGAGAFVFACCVIVVWSWADAPPAAAAELPEAPVGQLAVSAPVVVGGASELPSQIAPGPAFGGAVPQLATANAAAGALAITYPGDDARYSTFSPLEAAPSSVQQIRPSVVLGATATPVPAVATRVTSAATASTFVEHTGGMENASSLPGEAGGAASEVSVIATVSTPPSDLAPSSSQTQSLVRSRQSAHTAIRTHSGGLLLGAVVGGPQPLRPGDQARPMAALTGLPAPIKLAAGGVGAVVAALVLPTPELTRGPRRPSTRRRPVRFLQVLERPG